MSALRLFLGGWMLALMFALGLFILIIVVPFRQWGPPPPPAPITVSGAGISAAGAGSPIPSRVLSKATATPTRIASPVIASTPRAFSPSPITVGGGSPTATP